MKKELKNMRSLDYKKVEKLRKRWLTFLVTRYNACKEKVSCSNDVS